MRSLLESAQPWLGARLLGLPRALRRRAAGPPVEIDGQRLDPDLQFALLLVRLGQRRPLDEMTPAAARREYARAAVFEERPLPVAQTRDLGIPGPACRIPVRIYVPRDSTRPLPITVYFHGGGFVIGDLETHDGICRRLALGADCIVASVAYRLAPEAPFPAAVDDAYAATRWISEHAAELGGDPDRLAVAGDSAGGNLATVTCALAHDRGGPAIRHQLLFYPVTDIAGMTASKDLFESGFFLTRAHERWFTTHYLGDTNPSDPRVSPARRKNLAGLPPATVEIAGFDILRDEGLEYARRLREAGVPVRLTSHASLTHGYLGFTAAVPAAGHALDQAARALREGLQASAGADATSRSA